MLLYVLKPLDLEVLNFHELDCFPEYWCCTEVELIFGLELRVPSCLQYSEVYTKLFVVARNIWRVFLCFYAKKTL